MKKEWTGERLETFIQTRDTVDHLHRYAIALNHVQDKIVLDIASGEGYGSSLLCKKAKFVYGVDIDESSVIQAKQKYKAINLEYKVGSTDAIPLPDCSIDVVISFETIEHHDKHDEMLLEIRRVLKPKGRLIISTPDKHVYNDKRSYRNIFHIKELYKNEFIDLLSKYFQKKQVLNQVFSNGNSIIFDDQFDKKIELVRGDFSFIQMLEKEAMYLIIIASDIDFRLQETSIFEGSNILKNKNDSALEEYKNSTTYKVGKYILLPFKLFKRFIK